MTMDQRHSALLWLLVIIGHALLISTGRGSDMSTSDSAPVITEHPLDILVVKGDPATLRCASSGENVEISWYKDGELVKVGNGHRLLLPNGSLFLLKVASGGTDSDAGSYYCIARNQYGEVRSQEASVKIALLRDEFKINPRSTQATLGTGAMLECTPPKAFPEPVVTWRKDDRELSTVEDGRLKLHPAGNLVIENVQRSDAVGERISKSARLSVYEKPRFLTEPKDTMAEVNGSALFDCRVAGEPIPSISWKKSNDQMPLGRAYVTKDSKGLKIDRVQPEDAGEYICSAKNSVGTIEASAKLRVNAKPIFSKLPQNVRIPIGRSAVFECEADGQPAPNTFWSKEGDQHFTFFSGLISSDGRIQVTKEGRLIIDDVRPIDQGRYVCAAVNAAGSTLAKASLSVISSGSPLFPPPVIQYGHQNQTLTVNDTAILPCLSRGRVVPTVSWLRNGQQLNLSEYGGKQRYRLLATGTLHILVLRKSDSGIYTCRAKNEDGEATWTASLTVEEHTNPHTLFQRMPEQEAFPSQPGKPTVVVLGEDSVELEWTPPKRQGSSPIIGYILQYWSPELEGSWQNVLDVVLSTRFKVRRLEPEHSYAFVVRAENSNGIGLPSEISELVITKASTSMAGREHLSAYGTDLETARARLTSEQLIKLQEVRALNSTAMQLTWKRQRKEPLIQGYYIKWRGPPLDPHHPGWVNVSEPEAQSVIINGLKPFNSYEFFVIPYHRSVQGMPSNSLDGTTYEAAPNLPPSDVRVRMLNRTSLRVSWRPPPAAGINGVLKGFLINIRGNQSEERNITTNERATSVTLYRLIPDATYTIRIAARTNFEDWGVFYNAEPVHMTDETLREHIRLATEMRGSGSDVWYRQPWSVLAIGVVLWFILILLILLLWYRCCYSGRGHRKNVDSNNDREFIKIRDGSVVANQCNVLTRNAFWASRDQFGDVNEEHSHIHSSSREGLGASGVVAEGRDNIKCGMVMNSESDMGDRQLPHYPMEHPSSCRHRPYNPDEYPSEAATCAPSYCGICDAAGTMPRHPSHHTHTHPHHCPHGLHQPHPHYYQPYYPAAPPPGNTCCPYNCSTMRKGGDSPHSPPHHYHYAYLPESGRGSDPSSGGAAPLSTFSYAQRRQLVVNEYYDDPSPYATTTLILNPPSNSSCQSGGDGEGRSVEHNIGTKNLQGAADASRHPALPLSEVPTRAPNSTNAAKQHFLSRAAVDRLEHSSCQYCCEHEQYAGHAQHPTQGQCMVCPSCSRGHYQHHHTNSCSTLLDDASSSLSSRHQRLLTTAGDETVGSHNAPLGSHRSTAPQPKRNQNPYSSYKGPSFPTNSNNNSDCGNEVRGDDGQYFYHRREGPLATAYHRQSVFPSSTIANSGRGGVRHSRSSSVNAEGRNGSSSGSFKWRDHVKCKGHLHESIQHPSSLQQLPSSHGKRASTCHESPATDVSYVQGSSDGTNGSSKAARAAFDGYGAGVNANLMDMIPPPPPAEGHESGIMGRDEMEDGTGCSSTNDYDIVAEMEELARKRRSDPNILLRSLTNGQRSSMQYKGSKRSGDFTTSTGSKRRSESDGRRNRTAPHHQQKSNSNHRVSLIEDGPIGKVGEADPLMTCDFEADGELSDEFDSDAELGSQTTRGAELANGEFIAAYDSTVHNPQITNKIAIAEDDYVGPATPISRLPIKQQPLMGVTSFSQPTAGNDSYRSGKKSKSRLNDQGPTPRNDICVEAATRSEA